MTKTCYHHMLFVGGVGFYSKITFLTPISRSKVICRSKSCDMLGQGQWSFPPSLVKIGQVMTELQRDWQKKEERILQRQNKTACLPSCKKTWKYGKGHLYTKYITVRGRPRSFRKLVTAQTHCYPGKWVQKTLRRVQKVYWNKIKIAIRFIC